MITIVFLSIAMLGHIELMAMLGHIKMVSCMIIGVSVYSRMMFEYMWCIHRFMIITVMMLIEVRLLVRRLMHRMAVVMRVSMVKGMMDCVLMEMHRLYITLIIVGMI